MGMLHLLHSVIKFWKQEKSLQAYSHKNVIGNKAKRPGSEQKHTYTLLNHILRAANLTGSKENKKQ